jgi:hypothetical protein
MNTETDFNGLKPLPAREERILLALLAGRSAKEICETVGVSRTTLWRLRGRSDFQQRLDDAKAEAFSAAVALLHAGAVTFVETLRGVCLDEKARGSEKATAARSGLDALFQARGQSLEARVAAIEKAREEDRK